MIKKCTVGENANDVTNVIFGTGDVMFHGLYFSEHPDRYSLGFYDMPARGIGDTTEEFTGLTTDQMPAPVQVIFSFDNPQSVTAVIHSLIELQKRMFDKDQGNKTMLV